MRIFALLVLLASCERPLTEDERLVREGADEVAALSLRLNPPPPPPPPPPSVLSAPDEIVEFVRSHADDDAPWKVTVYQLAATEVVRRQRVLGRAASVRVIAALMQPIYTDGECGCATDESTGIRIARGGQTLDLVYNAGHLFLTPEGHDGRFVMLLDSVWIEDLL